MENSQTVEISLKFSLIIRRRLNCHSFCIELTWQIFKNPTKNRFFNQYLASDTTLTQNLHIVQTLEILQGSNNQFAYLPIKWSTGVRFHPRNQKHTFLGEQASHRLIYFVVSVESEKLKVIANIRSYRYYLIIIHKSKRN